MDDPENKNPLNKLLESLMEQFTTDQPSEVILSLVSFEHEHTEKMLSTYHPFVLMTEDALDLVVTMIHKINYLPHDHWRPHCAIQYVSMVEIVKALLSGHRNLMHGYPDASFRTLRGAFEHLVALVFVSCHNDDEDVMWNPFAKSSRKPGTKSFVITNFIKHDLKLDFGPLYKIWSGFSHGNLNQSISDYLELAKSNREGNQKPIEIRFEWNQKMVEVCMNSLYLLIWITCRQIDQWFLKDAELTLIPEHELERFQAATKCFGLVLQHTPNVFSNMPDTVNNMMEIVSVAESGGDWKAKAVELAG